MWCMCLILRYLIYLDYIGRLCGLACNGFILYRRTCRYWFNSIAGKGYQLFSFWVYAISQNNYQKFCLKSFYKFGELWFRCFSNWLRKIFLTIIGTANHRLIAKFSLGNLWLMKPSWSVADEPTVWAPTSALIDLLFGNTREIIISHLLCHTLCNLNLHHITSPIFPSWPAPSRFMSHALI